VSPEDVPGPVITIEALFPWLAVLAPAPVEEPEDEPLSEAA
jgi:hypothetical protein